MPKSKLVKFSLFVVLAVVLVFTTSVSATGTSTDVSRVVYFTIQNNNVCKADDSYRTSVLLNINNTGASSADVTVYLFNDAGIEVTHEGSTGVLSGYSDSTFVPGTKFTLPAKTTAHYNKGFSGGSPILAPCTDRPAYGKIVVHNDAGLLMANGEARGIEITTPITVHTNTPIVVNGGTPF